MLQHRHLWARPSDWRARGQGLLLRALRYCDEAIERARRRFTPAPVTLFRDVTAPWLGSALCVAARLRLADLLGDRVLPLAELADKAGIGEAELRRLLGVLQAHGYFHIDDQASVRSTSLSRALRRDVAGAFAELQGRGWYRQAFSSGHVLEGWRGGETPFQVATEQHFFDYLEAHPEARDLFLQAMADVTRFCTPYLACELTLGPGESLLDVGGGDGELARALAHRYPGNSLAVLDRALTDTSLCGETPNYTFHQGDFFESLPRGYGHICLKNILHDWGDERCVAILRRCREAVTRGDHLTVIECPLPEPGEAPESRASTFALDWNVWLTLSGKERPVSAYLALFEQSGWRGTDIRATATPYRLIRALAE